MAKAARKKQGAANDDAAAGQTEGESTAAYFRRQFEENRKLLKTRSNDELLRRWLADHPGETAVPDGIKNTLANVKSGLRAKLHIRRRRRKAARAEAQEPAAAGRAARHAGVGAHRLEALEEQIDDCLGLAKSLDRQGLDPVIKLLHRARNEVVWKLGQ